MTYPVCSESRWVAAQAGRTRADEHNFPSDRIRSDRRAETETELLGNMSLRRILGYRWHDYMSNDLVLRDARLRQVTCIVGSAHFASVGMWRDLVLPTNFLA